MMSQSSGSSGRGDVTWPDAVHPPDVQGRDLDSWVGAGPPGPAPGFPPATRITGRLKVGDTVSAQLTRAAGGRYVVSEIQDPPGLP
jgi:hypothetical protein